MWYLGGLCCKDYDHVRGIGISNRWVILWVRRYGINDQVMKMFGCWEASWGLHVYKIRKKMLLRGVEVG